MGRCLESLKIAAVLVVLVCCSAFAANTKKTLTFTAEDSSQYTVSHSENLIFEGDALNLVGNASSATYPYIELKSNEARQFLRMKSLRQYGQNIYGVRYIISNDAGQTWYWLNQDSPSDWVVSNGSYQQATSYDGTFLLINKFKKRGPNDEFVFRIFFAFPQNFDATEDSIQLDSIVIEYDNNREVANVIVTTDTVIQTILAHDTVIRNMVTHDTIVNTVVRTDTVTAIRTVVERDTVEKLVVQRDTLVRRDTVIRVIIEKDTINHTVEVVHRDTVVNTVFLHDTISQTDTLVHRDTVVNTVLQVDSVIVTKTVTDTVRDTLTTVETVTLHDTVYSTIVKQDTLVRIDTIYQVLVRNDTIVRTDTLVQKVIEVQTVLQTDTVVQKDTVTNVIHEVDTILQAEIVRDTVVLTNTIIDTVVKEVLPYPDYTPGCDTCNKTACGKPVVVEAGDSIELHAQAFNDSGEYIGELPWPETEPEEELGGCGGAQAFSPEEALDQFVQVGPWYYHLIVKPSVMVKIKIHVLIEGNLIELRNYRTHPGDTIVLVAVGEDEFGNQTGEVDVDWFATGDSAGVSGLGCFVADQSGSRTTIVAGPSLGQLGFRYEGQTIITPDSVEMEVILLTNPVAHVLVRDSCNGGGQVIDQLTMAAGDTMDLYVAAYDSNWQYMNDLAVWFEGDGVVRDHIQLQLNNSLLVTPEQSGAGYMKLSYQSGETGRITVVVEVEVTVSTAYRLEIRTGPNGTGTLLDSIESDVFTSIGQILNLYASVVDQYGNHICDTVVEWSASAQYGVDVNTAIDSGGHPYARIAAEAISNGQITATLPGLDTVTTDTINILPEVESIKIRTAAGGAGRELSDQDTSITVDLPLSLYAAGYNASDAFVGDVSVEWSSSDTAQDLDPQLTANFIFSPKKPGLGKIMALLKKELDYLADTTGDVSVAVGNPAYVVIQDEPVGIALEASYQFSAIVTDWAGNQIVNTPVAWSLVGDAVGTLTATGKLTTAAQGKARIVAAYGALRDTTGEFSVVDGYPLTDEGGTFVFAPEAVTVVVPAQGGLKGHVLDVDLAPGTVSIQSFVKVRGPLSFEDCTKEYFATAVTLRVGYAQGDIDTLTALGKTTADIRLYRYNQTIGEWQVEHNGLNQTDSQRVSVATNQIFDKYMLGVDLANPSLVSVTMPDTVNQGLPFNVTGIVSDNMTNCKAYVYSKRFGDATFSVDSVQLSGVIDTFTVTIPAPMVSEQGTAIMVKVSDGHAATYSGDGGGTGAIGPIVKVSNVIYPAIIPETTWVVLSMPYTPAQKSPKQFFSAYGQFKMHWDIAEIQNGVLVEYDTASANIELKAGGMYWFATAASGTILRIPTGYTQSPDDTFKVVVAAKKWAGLGVPYPAAVAVADIRKATGADTLKMKTFMYTDGEVWEPTLDSLRPWKGYYVYNSGTAPITIKFPPVRMQTAPVAKRQLARAGEWVFGVRARTAQRTDDLKLFGCMSGNAPELYTTPTPPAGKSVHKGVRMNFALDNASYCVDIRDGLQGGAVWTLDAGSLTAAQSVTLEFAQALGALPEDFKLVVVDNGRGLKFDVTRTLQYGFVAEGVSKSLRVYAGTQGYVDMATSGIKPAPMAFALMPNYPNPFNPVTSIRFQVPELEGSASMPGAEWAVLKVYNMRGQEVRTLVNRPVQGGYYTVTWDAKDHRSRPCATGNYVYRLQIGSEFSKSLRMTLVK